MISVISLRARILDSAPAPGSLMASANGKQVFRIVGVVMLRRAGCDRETRYRLHCVPIPAAEVPNGEPVHAWRWDRSPPPPRRAPPAAASEMVPMVAPRLRPGGGRTGKRRQRQMDWSGVDFGPVLRRKDCRDHAGQVIREADVEVDDGPDPDHPNRKVRRAQRVDTLLRLVREGSIGRRELEAAEILRVCLERQEPAMVGQQIALAQLAPFARDWISAAQLYACKFTRDAAAALGPRLWPPVLWLCLGGTVASFARLQQIRKASACERVTAGFAALADHVSGPEQRRAA